MATPWPTAAGDRFVLARVPLHLRPIQAHPPQPQRAQLRRHLQYLLEQPLQLAQKPLPEIRYRVMVRMLVSGYVPKRYRVIRRLLQLPARKHSRGIAVEQQCHHHDRMIRSPAATTAVPARYFSQIELLYYFHYKACHMLVRQPLLYGWRQEHRRVPIKRAKVVCHVHSVGCRLRLQLYPISAAMPNPNSACSPGYYSATAAPQLSFSCPGAANPTDS